ncbi:MAG: DUF3310 domain-containing protein [Prevotella sp.]
MIRIEDIKIGAVLQISKGNLFKIADSVFADKIDPLGSSNRIQYVKVIDIAIPDKKCEIVAFFKPELAAACVDIVDLAMYSIFSDFKELPINKTEQVSHPSHYAWLKDLCGIEPLDICRHLDFNTGNAIKYLLRKDKVDGNKTKTEKRIEDLRKAVFYIQDEIKLLEHGTD